MKYVYSILICFLAFGFLSAQEWEELGPPPFYKHHSNGFEFEGKAIIFEGTLDEGQSNEIWEYNPADDSWLEIGTFPGQGRGFAIGDDWNGKYYYGFGTSNAGRLNDLWEYDPATNEFTELPTCPCPGRAHPALIAEHDKIFMGTGSGPNGDLADWWVYDMITMEWTQKDNMPGGIRHHPFQFVDENYVYVGGGHRQNWMKWNIVNETWTDIDPTPNGRVAGSQFSYKGKGYLVGGDDRFHDHIPAEETFMEYDPDSDTWKQLPQLPNGSRWANSSVVIDEILYFFGGMTFIDGGTIEDFTMWKFDLTSLDAPTNIDDLEELNINISPNPFSDFVQIESSKLGNNNLSIEVYNNQGVLLYEQKDLNNEKVNLSFLASGIYVLKITNTEGISSLKKLTKI